MSRRNSIIVIAAVAILIIVGLLLFYFRSANTGTGNQSTTTQSAVNPFGNAPANSTISPFGTSNSKTNQTNTSNKNLAKLIELYANPVSGSMFFANKNNQDVLQFVDRATGNVYQYLSQSESGEPRRLTDTTIPKIEDVVWSSAGNSLVYRYLDNDTDTIDSFAGAITSSSTSGIIGQINGVFLSPNISEIVSNPKGDKIFGLLERSDGSGSYGVMSNFDNTSKKQSFDSPVSFWNISWPANSTITFTTKPTYKDYGYLYFFNTQTDSFERILGDLAGLSTLTNSDASLVAYSASQNNSFNLGVYGVKNKTSENITLSTLTDKCVWSIQNNTVLYCAVPQTINPDSYPDAWYQGTESFSDNIWKIDTKTGATTQIYQTGVNENANIDAMNLVISPDDKYLAFTNKNDLSLWILALQQ